MRRELRRSGSLTLAIAALALTSHQVPTAAPAELDPAAGPALEMRRLSGPRADVAALILGGQESGSLRVAALAVPDCPPAAGVGAGAGAPVTLWAEIEAASLLEAVASRDDAEPPESVRVELYVYAMTKAGEIVASLSEWVRIPLADLTGLLPGGGVKLAATLELPPGEAQLRLLVREPRSQRFALRVLGVAAPGHATTRPSLGPPLFPDAGHRWLTVRSAGASDGAGGMRYGLPAALPVVVSGDERSFRLSGCRLAGATFAGRLLDAERRAAAGAVVRFEPPSAPAGTVRVPELPPGLYRLEVSARSPAGESTAAVALFVAPPGYLTGRASADSDAPPPWTALGGAETREEAPEEALAELDRSGGSARIQALASAYRQVLRQLAMGRREEAVELLLRLQAAAVEGGDGKRQKSLKRLEQAQTMVTRDLLAREPECALPLLLLHLDLHRRYLEAPGGSSVLLNATRNRVRALAEAYAAKARSEMAPALAAVSLVEMAVALERTQQRLSALIVLRDAIALDPANPNALLELAYQYENHGFDDQALTLLEALLEVEPRSDEGRLRLAMNRFRSGREEEAVAILERLIAEGSTDWVLAVAYQELGHFLLRSGRPQEAVRLLRGAVVRLPEVQRLYVELAYALDRSGHRQAGAEVAAAVPAAEGPASPRLLYRVTPPEESSRARDDLVRHATARLPLLARMLAPRGEEG